jgi:hypothetical protein
MPDPSLPNSSLQYSGPGFFDLSPLPTDFSISASPDGATSRLEAPSSSISPFHKSPFATTQQLPNDSDPTVGSNNRETPSATTSDPSIKDQREDPSLSGTTAQVVTAVPGHSLPQTQASHQVAADAPTPVHSPTGTDSQVQQLHVHTRETSTDLDTDQIAGRSSLNTAQLIQSVNQTEMRVGMHTNEFGSISIHTTVSQQQMITQISLENTDLSHAIAAHAASVQAKLSDEHGIHSVIEVNNSTAFGQGASESGTSRDQRAQATRQVHSQFQSADSDLPIVATTTNSMGNRLDIQA